jgi:hypothetical protein
MGITECIDQNISRNRGKKTTAKGRQVLCVIFLQLSLLESPDIVDLEAQNAHYQYGKGSSESSAKRVNARLYRDFSLEVEEIYFE